VIQIIECPRRRPRPAGMGRALICAAVADLVVLAIAYAIWASL
jgi:hypothetical protein